MAKLAAQYTYSDAELLALYREGLAMLSQNKSYSIRGKTYTRADEAFFIKMIAWLEGRIVAANRRSSVVHGRHTRSGGRSGNDIEY